MSACLLIHHRFSNEHSAGTFHTLGDLPKRKTNHLNHKSPVFHLAHDDDLSPSVDERFPEPLTIPSPAVPFPGSPTPPSSQLSSSVSPPSPTSPRAQLRSGASAPILLPNGKPLKSSLKSSHPMTTPPRAHHTHSRSRSEPSSPAHKNVHFPEKDHGLATVRIYDRSACPDALGNTTNDNGNETEAESEETPPRRFPFPPLFNYEIDPSKSSPVPSESSLPEILLLESLDLSQFSSSSTLAMKPSLTGSVLVRNLAYEKHVAVRFTLDDWHTVSEVGAHYVESRTDPPSHILPSIPASISEDTSPQRRKDWDRFTFTIQLGDYIQSLRTRTLWLAVRYRIDSTYPEAGFTQYGQGGEWWDNNGGKNYRVSFRPTVTAPPFSRGRPRRGAISEPVFVLQPKPEPMVACKEHALGIMTPSLPNKGVQLVNETDRPSMLLRAGKLDLCNYAPPTVRATLSISLCSEVPLPSITSPESPLLASAQSSSDDDIMSPISSALSTPSVSPLMIPRVIISGHPATFTQPHSPSQVDDITLFSWPGDVAEWDWPTHRKPRDEGPQGIDIIPIPETPDLRMSSGRKVLADSDSLYEVFVAQLCFAQGSPSNRHGSDDIGIMA